MQCQHVFCINHGVGIDYRDKTAKITAKMTITKSGNFSMVGHLTHLARALQNTWAGTGYILGFSFINSKVCTTPLTLLRSKKIQNERDFSEWKMSKWVLRTTKCIQDGYPLPAGIHRRLRTVKHMKLCWEKQIELWNSLRGKIALVLNKV